MQLKKSPFLNYTEMAEISNIWNNEYPYFLIHDSLLSFERYVQQLNNAKHQIAQFENKIIGWTVKFEREEKNWFVIILDSKYQNRGIGLGLMKSLMLDSTELNGWVIDKDIYLKRDGTIYKSPINFYKKLGFEITTDRATFENFEAVKIRWRGPLSA